MFRVAGFASRVRRSQDIGRFRPEAYEKLAQFILLIPHNQDIIPNNHELLRFEVK